LQGIEFARKEKWKKKLCILVICGIKKKENARKGKVKSAKKGNCKDWNLEGNGIYKRKKFARN